MPLSLGSLTFPAAVPEPDLFTGVVSLDPSLAVLIAALPPILTKWLGDAWDSLGTGFQLINGVYAFDPFEVYDAANVPVDDGSLPALYVYSSTLGSTHICDSLQETESEISILWLPPSRSQEDNRLGDSLFRNFGRAIAMLVRRERDPIWVAESDKLTDSDPIVEAKRAAARTFGTNIPDACGFSRWYQPLKDACIRTHFVLLPNRYDGFLAKITACELSQLASDADSDGSALDDGYSPTSLEQTFNTGGSTPLQTGGFDKPPAT